jgi:hypothetical protein
MDCKALICTCMRNMSALAKGTCHTQCTSHADTLGAPARQWTATCSPLGRMSSRHWQGPHTCFDEHAASSVGFLVHLHHSPSCAVATVAVAVQTSAMGVGMPMGLLVHMAVGVGVGMGIPNLGAVVLLALHGDRVDPESEWGWADVHHDAVASARRLVHGHHHVAAVRQQVLCGCRGDIQ